MKTVASLLHKILKENTLERSEAFLNLLTLIRITQQDITPAFSYITTRFYKYVSI